MAELRQFQGRNGWSFAGKGLAPRVQSAATVRCSFLALGWLGVFVACQPLPCVGDSCSCYGDPEAPDANAGCAKCTPPRTCERIFDRVRECGLEVRGSAEACEDRIRRDHTCHESIASLDCAVLDVACANRETSCYAELVASGVTSCTESLVIAADGVSETVEPCASGSCNMGKCVECVPFVLECAPGFVCADERCRAACDDDLDCGANNRCFGGACDPPIGTPCDSQSDCGTRWCGNPMNASPMICTEPCLDCSGGPHCGCPSGFACIDTFCMPS